MRPSAGIIDAHVHVYAPAEAEERARDRSAAWPHPTHVAELRAVAQPHGVTGLILIETTADLGENRRLLDVAAAEPYVVALIGNLAAGTPGFGERLDAHASDPRFRGVRAGTPWCPLDLGNPRLIADVQLLAERGLALDTVKVGGGDAELLERLVTLAERVPNLRIVIDHLPFAAAYDAAARPEYERRLRDLAQHPNVYAKISNVLPRSGAIPDDPAWYAPMLDGLTELFGPDRIVYASNYPVSARTAPYGRAFAVVHDYFARRRPDLAERYFRTNALAAYGLDAAE